MSVYFALQLFRWTALTVALLSAILKTFFVVKAKAKLAHVPIKAITWFSHVEVQGTTSEFKRQYMKRSNVLTQTFTVSFIIALILFMVHVNF
jgi:hypothetical protein